MLPDLTQSGHKAIFVGGEVMLWLVMKLSDMTTCPSMTF